MAETTTEFDWKSYLGKAEDKREKFIALPPGVWIWTCIGASFREEEVESKQDPGEKYTTRSVLFELIPEEMLSGDVETGNAMTDQNRAVERKWHRVQLRKATDTEQLIKDLETLGCYNPKLPLVTEDGQPDCLSLVSEKLPKVLAEAKVHRRKDGNATVIIDAIAKP